MKTCPVLVALMLWSSAACHAQAVPVPPVPADALALGKLMGLVHGANAFKTECAIANGSREFDAPFDNWTARNERLIDRLDARGRALPWLNADGFGPAEFWSRLQRREAAATMRQVAELVKNDSRQSCTAMARTFESGEYDLARFTGDLQAAGVVLP